MVSLQLATECKEMKKSSDIRGDIHKDGILKIIKDKSSRDWLRYGVKGTEIVKRMHLKRQTVDEHLKKLVADGKIKKIARGRYLPREPSVQCDKPFMIDYFSASQIKRWFGEYVHQSQ